MCIFGKWILEKWNGTDGPQEIEEKRVHLLEKKKKKGQSPCVRTIFSTQQESILLVKLNAILDYTANFGNLTAAQWCRGMVILFALHHKMKSQTGSIANAQFHWFFHIRLSFFEGFFLNGRTWNMFQNAFFGFFCIWHGAGAELVYIQGARTADL